MLEQNDVKGSCLPEVILNLYTVCCQVKGGAVSYSADFIVICCIYIAGLLRTINSNNRQVPTSS